MTETASTALALHFAGLTKVFAGPVEAISPLTFAVAGGEFLALLGPSGCGKSTLLRLIAGLDRPTSGTIEISRPADSPARPSDIAYVFQDAHLLPWRTVLGNVTLPLELLRTPRHTHRTAALHALEQIGLADSIDRYPAQLSGGMRMRVSLARALVTSPRLLLLDEPFAALDEITRQKLDDLLRALWVQRRMTTIFVTHSIQEAAYLANRVIVLTKRPAAVILDHTLDFPETRSPEFRTSEVFARESRTLFNALQRAGEVL